MPKYYRPTTPSRRHTQGYDFSDLSGVSPLKSLTVGMRGPVARNNKGRITTRHRGGGVKRAYRIIDFKQDRFDVPARVYSIEYDPNRTTRIARLHYIDGEKRYILAPAGLKVGNTVITSEKTNLEPGNRMRLKNVPQGTMVHNIEIKAGRGAVVLRCRS